MSWTRALILLAVAVPYALGAVLLVRSVRNRALPKVGRPAYLTALGLLAAGGVVWTALSGDAETDLPWAWAVALLLGVAAASAVRRPERTGRYLRVTAVAAPVLAAGAMAALYAFGSGVESGDGGTEPVAQMVFVAILGSGFFYSLPTFAVSMLLITSAATATTPPRGWYPAPDSPGQLRFWTGEAWTDQVRPAEPSTQAGPEPSAPRQKAPT